MTFSPEKKETYIDARVEGERNRIRLVVDVVHCLDCHTSVSTSTIKRNILRDLSRSLFPCSRNELSLSEMEEKGERTSNEEESSRIKTESHVFVEGWIEGTRD